MASSTKVPRLDDTSSIRTTDGDHTVVDLNVSNVSSSSLQSEDGDLNDSNTSSLTLDGDLNDSNTSSLTLDGSSTNWNDSSLVDRLSIRIVWKKKDYEYLLPSLLPFPQAIANLNNKVFQNYTIKNLQPQYQQLYNILYQLIKQRYSVIQEEQCDDSFDHFTTDLTKKEGVYWGHASWGDKVGSSRHVKKRVHPNYIIPARRLQPLSKNYQVVAAGNGGNGGDNGDMWITCE